MKVGAHARAHGDRRQAAAAHTPRLVAARIIRPPPAGISRAVENFKISTGSTSRIRIGASSMPPTTTNASGRCTCEPMPVEKAAGSKPTQATMQVITTGLNWVRQVCSMALARSRPDSKLKW